MIGKLTGIIDLVEEDKAIIDVNGVGYIIFISLKTSNFLKQFDQKNKISIITETIVKQDAIEIYGFVSEIEKRWFSELIKVQGIGAKMAQKILGFLTIEDIAKAIVSNDIKSFSQISGIGAKIAGRLVSELKDLPKKLGIDLVNFSDKISDLDSLLKKQIFVDALSALENLGYKKSECLKAIEFSLKEDDNITLENLITQSLRKLNVSKL